MGDGDLELGAWFLGSPMEDVFLADRPHIVEPLEVLEVADIGLDEG